MICDICDAPLINSKFDKIALICSAQIPKGNVKISRDMCISMIDASYQDVSSIDEYDYYDFYHHFLYYKENTYLTYKKIYFIDGYNILISKNKFHFSKFSEDLKKEIDLPEDLNPKNYIEFIKNYEMIK